MFKCIFILPLVFAWVSAVLSGAHDKQEYTQGYRYSRPAPHYLPPYQEAHTESSAYYVQATPAASSEWQTASWPSNNYASSSASALYGQTSRPSLTISNNNNHKSNGYNYEATASKEYYASTARPGYQYPEPSGSNYKPTAGYSYLPPSESSAFSQISKPQSSNAIYETHIPSGEYNYAPPQATNSMQYYYNKPSSNLGYNADTSTSYDVTSFNGASDFNAQSSGLYQKPNVDNSYKGTQFNNNNNNQQYYGQYEQAASQSYTLPSHLSSSFQVPTQQQRYNNNYAANQQAPSRLYLPPKRDFQAPYYK